MISYVRIKLTYLMSRNLRSIELGERLVKLMGSELNDSAY